MLRESTRGYVPLYESHRMPAQKTVLTGAECTRLVCETAGRSGRTRSAVVCESRSFVEAGGASVRIWLAALVLAAMGAEGASAQSAGESACERKDADRVYCQDGKPRPVCSENGHLVWSDTRDALSQGELIFLTKFGAVSKPRCTDKPKN